MDRRKREEGVNWKREEERLEEKEEHEWGITKQVNRKRNESK